jgi:hypothetical protein
MASNALFACVLKPHHDTIKFVRHFMVNLNFLNVKVEGEIKDQIMNMMYLITIYQKSIR